MFRPVPSKQHVYRLRDEQRKWIDGHGGCEAAYVERYGGDGQGFKYGDGGSAIWHADKAELDRLEIACDFYDTR